jgi:Trm5-related predicted tRNA methylase
LKKWMESGLYVQVAAVMMVVYYGFISGLVAEETQMAEFEGRIEEKYRQTSVDNYLSNFSTHEEYWIRLDNGKAFELTASLYESIKRGEKVKLVQMNAGTMIFRQ